MVATPMGWQARYTKWLLSLMTNLVLLSCWEPAQLVVAFWEYGPVHLMPSKP